MKFLIVLAAALSVAAAGSVEEPVPLKDYVPSVEDIEGRVTNGQAAATNQFPYQAGLSLRQNAISSSWCGASLLSSTWVLTAAHCTNGIQSVTIYLGSTVRASPTVSYTVDRSAVIQHTGYNANTLANDVSLIKIPSVSFSASIAPIRLPATASSYSTYAGSSAVVSGWGRTSDTGSVSNNLNYANVEIITNTLCSATYGTSVITPAVICISTPRGVSTCQGDSGGPLVLQSENILIGVTSFVASAGCTAGFPSGFARVTSHLPWIAQNTGISY